MSLPLFDRLRALRGRIRDRIQRVNARSETAVLGAGQHLRTVTDIAETHIVQLRDVLGGPLGTSNSELHRAIAAQGAHVRAHGMELGAAVAAHAADVAAVAESVRQITTAAAQIERANSAARVLSVNVRIESARSGAAVFKAIATEMHALSQSIVEANRRVQDLATAMETTLPRLVEQSNTLRAMVSTYADEARVRVEKIDTEVVALRRTIDKTLTASDGALAAIISASQGGLSELQFQDVCAQSLLQVDQWQGALVREAAAELGLKVEIEPEIVGVSAEEEIMDRATAGQLVEF